MIEKLIGKRFNRISYAADMLCLGVGDDVEYKMNDHRPEFSIHVQCQWRFVRGGEIILASRDMYEPANPNAPNSWYDDYFNGLSNDESLFVESIPDFHKKMQGSEVLKTEISILGDLKIEFSYGIYFESFIPCSRKGEFWRAIDFKTGEHFLIYDI